MDGASACVYARKLRRPVPRERGERLRRLGKPKAPGRDCPTGVKYCKQAHEAPSIDHIDRGARRAHTRRLIHFGEGVGPALLRAGPTP
jgi:hypothetical protein